MFMAAKRWLWTARWPTHNWPGKLLYLLLLLHTLSTIVSAVPTSTMNLLPLNSTKVAASSTSSVKNCTKCDNAASSLVGAVSPFQQAQTLTARVSSFSPVYSLKSPLLRVPSIVEPRTTVIETTVAPTTSFDAGISQDDEPSLPEHSRDSPASSTITTEATPKSTAYPQFGLGQFSHREVPHENGEDDEDYPSYKGHENPNYPNVIRTALPENKEFSENIEFNDQFSGHFTDDIFKVIHKRERTLIIGDRHLLPELLDNDLNVQISFEHGAFEGCYCDHHYRITELRTDDHESENHDLGENSSKSNSTSRKVIKQQENVFCFCTGESIIHLPQNFSQNVRKIVLNRIGLKVLRAGVFEIYADSLTEIHLNNLPKFHLIESGAFNKLPNLMTINIRLAPMLKFIPQGTFIGSIPMLMHLKIIHCGLEQMPLLFQDKSDRIITMIDFDNSRIRNLTTRSVNVRAENVNIEYNEIEFVGNHAFLDSMIAKLSLKGNRKLVRLEELAFSGLKELRELDLSLTSITHLPTAGLSDFLEVLRITETYTLKEIPHVSHFKKMIEAQLTYPYHCCAFKNPANHKSPENKMNIKNMFDDTFCKPNSKKTQRRRRSTFTPNWSIEWLFEKAVNLLKETFGWSHSRRKRFSQGSFGRFIIPSNNDSRSNDSAVYGVPIYGQRNRSQDGENYSPFDDLQKSIIHNQEVDYEDNEQDILDELPGRFVDDPLTSSPGNKLLTFCGNISTVKRNIICSPEPDAFNPCEDVMGNFFLRCIIWFVGCSAVLGNLAVVVVLGSSKFSLNVSQFLVLNLAIADLMMGIYLLALAIMDIRTMGVYFNFAIDWQHAWWGCSLFGGLTVFGSVLSIFTLTVITLERWFAITYAIQLNRRLKSGMAAKVMVGGWAYAFLMAILPSAFGINSYTKTSICLPMEHKTISDIAYLVILLSINCIAFILITLCYGKMYISIISQKTRATMNDMTIAKRMSMLVFTDFACWAPIAFFGLTAIAGHPLIDLTKSKFLLVTFYPLNSCANPFLYVILTKQYRRDFFILVSRYGICTKQAARYRNGQRQHHVNYYMKHHHRRENNSSELVPRPNANKSNPATGSIFSQLSCDGQNVHLYKYICKGHHHHHYCAYHKNNGNHSGASQSGAPTSGNCSHHSCSEVNHSHSEHEEASEKQPCCSRYPSQEGLDSKNGSVASCAAGDKSKHRKHKRCHNAHHHHHSHLRNCSCQHRRHCHGRGHYPNRKPGNGNKSGEPNTASCCHSAVFSTVNIYPELSNSDHGHHRLRGGHEACEKCSCRAENSSTDNNERNLVSSAKEKSAKRANHVNMSLTMPEERESTSREKGSSSSRDQVHIMRNQGTSSKGPLNGRVMYSRNKSIAVDRISSKMARESKPKRSLPFVSFIERFSISKIGRLRGGAKGPSKSGGRCSEQECSENSSPYSSTSSCHPHRYQHCHHCCDSAHLAASSAVEADRESSHASNRLPMEEQREILRQALAETTPLQEAVAVVEELSSGTRISMGSSSSSKKTGKVDSAQPAS